VHIAERAVARRGKLPRHDNLRREAVVRAGAAAQVVFVARHRGMSISYASAWPICFSIPAIQCPRDRQRRVVGWPAVLACSGEIYVGRMAGALLTAVGLPDLITTSLQEYEALALRLMIEPGLLTGLRQNWSGTSRTCRSSTSGGSPAISNQHIGRCGKPGQRRQRWGSRSHVAGSPDRAISAPRSRHTLCGL
jgi:hypothetical protein